MGAHALSGKIVLITGGQQRIGHATAIHFARAGADVALNYLDDAGEYDVPMPMAAVGEEILIEAMARGWGDRDSTSPWELQEEAARVKVRSST